jgi:uncharacterized protein YciI
VYYILFYDYVPNIVERREPFRAEHLSKVRELHEQGVIIMAGATGEPPAHAAIVFRTNDRARIEEFARSDPYVLNGLVTGWHVEPWHVVVGG